MEQTLFLILCAYLGIAFIVGLISGTRWRADPLMAAQMGAAWPVTLVIAASDHYRKWGRP